MRLRSYLTIYNSSSISFDAVETAQTALFLESYISSGLKKRQKMFFTYLYNHITPSVNIRHCTNAAHSPVAIEQQPVF